MQLNTDLSLFHHSLSGAFTDASLNGRSLTAQKDELLEPNDEAGDISTQGVAPKAWVRKDGTSYLLKNGDVRDI